MHYNMLFEIKIKWLFVYTVFHGQTIEERVKYSYKSHIFKVLIVEINLIFLMMKQGK